jgi:hypothetical protein
VFGINPALAAGLFEIELSHRLFSLLGFCPNARPVVLVKNSPTEKPNRLKRVPLKAQADSDGK